MLVLAETSVSQYSPSHSAIPGQNNNFRQIFQERICIIYSCLKITENGTFEEETKSDELK